MPLSRLDKPVVAVTMGDAAGVGPEVTIKALASPHLNRSARYIVIGDSYYLALLKKIIRSNLPIDIINPEDLYSGKQILKQNRLNLFDLKNIKDIRFGKSLASYGRASIQYIDLAIGLMRHKIADALVTAPVNKESINKAGIKFLGHTEYLFKKSGVKSVVMMFVSSRFKVVLVTRHLPLNKVSSNITEKKIKDTALLMDSALKKFFKIKNPRIGVLSLNPHAGEHGILGREEKAVISPAIKSLKPRIPSIAGPLPSDSAFYDLYNKKYDALVCMYHDQGMSPIKMLDRASLVNLTLGLPYIRTSPAHGTAFDIAGKGDADPSSMIEALNLAVQLIRRQAVI